ncbi:MAG: type II toxin-antitoxin system RelE/ParE family toxin, partial [Okeania sp. SIO2H7]|nr:type II toxin-antitoxin system RelE/ParE family toxin [Okeania sp. SIO2H7]
QLAFTTLPKAATLQEVPNVKAMVGIPNRYRIRIGNYRVGVEVKDETVTLMRVLHRGEFYRYFP